MVGNRVGEYGSDRTSYLLKSQTVKGDPILCVDRDKDYVTSEADEALVLRSERDGQSSWRPVTDLNQLKEFLAKASKEDKLENLGLWKDRGSWLVLPRDGKIQDREVVTMGQKAREPEKIDNEIETNVVGIQSRSWHHNACIDPSKLEVTARSTPTGELAVLSEPRVICESVVTSLEYSGKWDRAVYTRDGQTIRQELRHGYRESERYWQTYTPGPTSPTYNYVSVNLNESL